MYKVGNACVNIYIYIYTATIRDERYGPATYVLGLRISRDRDLILLLVANPCDAQENY